MINVLGHLVQMLNVQGRDPFFEELKDWSTHLAQHALGKWRGVLMSGIPCVCEHGCPRPAIGACVACGRPTCLAHALVSGSADAVCFVCVRNLVSKQRPASVEHAPPSDDELRKKHLKTLGLKPGASMEDVKRALRALSLKHHPDRVAPGRRANAERKMKEISAAYHWLLSHADGQEVAA